MAKKEGIPFHVIVRKFSQNKLNEDQMRVQLKYIAEAAQRNRSYGFKAGIQRKPIEAIELPEDHTVDGVATGFKYEYQARINMRNMKARTDDVAQKYFEAALKQVKSAASTKQWEVLGEQRELDAAVMEAERPPFILPELTEERVAKYFGSIYDRDPHIRLIYDSARTHVESDGSFRTHVLLYGPAASAKTSLLMGFKDMFEEDGQERVLQIDATTSSKAGFETMLLNRAIAGLLPEFIYIEEIEKQMKKVPAVFNALLSIMDSRGMISRNNARIGHVQRKTPITVWATSNDEYFIKHYDSGAIWSRFQRRLRCETPSRELLTLIVKDKIADYPGGKLEWVDPAVALGWDVLGTHDPREVIAIALDGKDRLLDGSFQEDVLATTEPFTNVDDFENKNSSQI
jgi:hypothetical protein